LGNYGPTIILEHQTEHGLIHTLYGHLSRASLTNITVGQPIKAVDQLAELGSAEVNGDYPPHLHFQLIMDMAEYTGDYPGVCAAEDLHFYKENCPDPMELLRLL